MCDVRDVHLEAFLLLGHKRCVSMKFVLINRCSQKVDTSTVTGTDRVCDIVRRRVKCIRREVWPIVRCSHLASLASLIHRRVCIPRPAFLSSYTNNRVPRTFYVDVYKITTIAKHPGSVTYRYLVTCRDEFHVAITVGLITDYCGV